MAFVLKQPLIIRLLAYIFIVCNLHSAYAAKKSNLSDLYYGEALFYAHQGLYFNAVTRLDAELIQHYALDEPDLDSLSYHRDDAEFGVGDMELRYRMHQKAGRAIERVLNAEDVPQIARNEAAYRLARIYFEKSYYVNAMHALELIEGPVPEAIEDDITMLRGQIQMQQRNYANAVKLFRSVKSSSDIDKSYAAYNLGIALVRDNKLKRGFAKLDEVGQSKTLKPELLSLRDKANLALGNKLLESGRPEDARPYFERVRLDGPFSNKALLWAGWANVAQKDFQRALVPWSLLHKRDSTDAAVQEALLALPYAYSKMEAYGRSALLYGEAVNEFSSEINRLDTSMQSILQGKMRVALLQDPDERSSTFIENLYKAEDAPETRYLLDLMASHDFQESVKNYRDMAFLKLNLEQWLSYIKAYRDIIGIRRLYYEPILPVIERDYKEQDALMQSVLLRRDEVARQLDIAQQRRDIYAFSTKAELAATRELDKIEYNLNNLTSQPGLAQSKSRLQRLRGVLSWQIGRDYDKRLALTHEHLKELDQRLEKLEQQNQKIVRLKREAYQSYEGYNAPFQRFSTRLQGLIARIQAVMQQQASFLERVAVKELDRRRKKLADYRVKARFALAESYDRATKKQVDEAERAIREQQQKIQEIPVEDDDSTVDAGEPNEAPITEPTEEATL